MTASPAPVRLWTVLLPADITSPLPDRLVAGSALVTDNPTGADGVVVVDVEGNLFDSVSLRRFVNRVALAVDRAAVRYPTTARLHLDASAVIAVATFDTDTGRLDVEPEWWETLCTWAGTDLTGANVLADGARWEAERELAAWAHTDPDMVRWLRQHGPSRYRTSTSP
jgi:hypothetical protein